MSWGRSLGYKKKSVGARKEPWGTPALTGCSCEDFHSEQTEVVYYWQKNKKDQMSDMKFHNT